MTLDELRDEIQRESQFVDKKSHSHNIISLALRQIAKEHGVIEANRAITDFDLTSKGWDHQSCPDQNTSIS